MKKVAFVCIHNSCRSQMAEAIAKELGKNLIDVYSAGVEEYPEVKHLAIKVIEELNIDMKNQMPKLIKDIPNDIDILITMGCGVECPYVPCTHREDWGLDDPSGKDISEFRKTRDIIIEKVKDLLTRIKDNKI
ncbi:MAG: arsenate reductase ArsC [Bacilli bacterium]